MIQIVEDNLCNPRVLRVHSTTSKMEIFVRQTRSGLVVRPERTGKISKDKAIALAQLYLDEHPNTIGVLPYSLEGKGIQELNQGAEPTQL